VHLINREIIKGGMKSCLLVFAALGLIALLFAGGCSQPAGQPAPVATPVQTLPAISEPTSSPATPATIVPAIKTPVPTLVIPAVPLPVTVKDSKLLFTILAPDGYSGRTIRVTKSTGYSIIYKTTIFNPAILRIGGIADDNTGDYLQLDDALTIFFYAAALNEDQNIKNLVRDKGVAFNETTVTYNGITYERFELESDPFSGNSGKTVIFVGSKGDANENGYIPEMIYSVTRASTLGETTLENMVRSFQWYTSRKIDSAPGIETDRPSFYQ
jgi:hypothetical protein